jgi:glucose-1-phosphate thymidylyltransferase
MRVIIPVAGAGTRLRPHTFSTPKPLLTVGGKPVLAHILEPILTLPITEVVFVLGVMADQMKEYIDSHYSFRTRYIEQKDLLGLGYALHLAMEQIDTGPVLIILGDTIIRCDFNQFILSGANVLGVREVSDPHRFGIAEISNNKVVGVEEKPSQPKTNLALVGLYYFSESAILAEELCTLVDSGKRTSGEIQFTDALQRMISRGVVFSPFEVTGWLDCGKKETLLSTNRILLNGLTAPRGHDTCTFIPPVSVGVDTTLEQSTLGPNVSIADGVQIRNSVIRDSIIDRNAIVEDSYIEESLVGPRVLVRGLRGKINIGESSEIMC